MQETDNTAQRTRKNNAVKQVASDMHAKHRSLPKKYYHAEKERESHIWSLRGFIFALVGIILFGLYTMSKMPEDILVHDAPNLGSGSTRKINEVPAYSAYAFGLYIWQAINTTDDLSTGYENNLSLYQAYIDPAFRAELLRRFNAERGERKGITRRLKEMPGATWTDENRIVQLSDGKFVVFLDVTIEEWLNDVKIRDSNFRYPLIIERVDYNPTTNPTGLEIKGFYSDVTRL